MYRVDRHSDEYQDLLRESIAQRRIAQRLDANPDCRDPEHPGCPQCEPQEDEDHA